METMRSTYNNAIIISTANNSCTRAGCFGERYALGVEDVVAVVVGKVKTRHCEISEMNGQEESKSSVMKGLREKERITGRGEL